MKKLLGFSVSFLDLSMTFFFPSKKRDINGNPKKTRIVLSIKDRWRYANLEKRRSGPYLTRRFNV